MGASLPLGGVPGESRRSRGPKTLPGQAQRRCAGRGRRTRIGGMTETAVSGAAVAEALRAGTRAPSPHNTQPWLFATRDGEIDVRLDESRVLRVCDPDGREAVLSCGAAVLNIRLALAAEGTACATTLLPDRREPLLLATLRLGAGRTPSAQDRRLAGVIAARHTHRRPFTGEAVPAAARHVLVRAAADEGARLHLLDGPGQFDTFAALLRRAEHVQRHDPAFVAELAEWTGRGDRGDGIPAAAGGPRPSSEPALSLRDFRGADATDATDATVAREYERTPLVAVLTTPGDTRRDALRAGQALQRVLLTATAAGLSASFLAQPVEVPRVRAELRSLLGGRDFPQTAWRLGHGHPGTPTPRRALDEVVTRPGTGERP
ncbi:nitroreductase [Saccharomonospora piscinae]|uniref:Nitroreductase n=2 Tax=Saccharomonospora piscinae TaxID=687388 RepID=A0A1V9A9R9_SACPI|nr:nitroreductase [Saccharomonospora piscinae]